MYKELYEVVLEEHRKVFEAQSVEDIEILMDAIIEAKRVFVFGAGREGIAARSFAMRIMHLGKETYWLLDDTTPGMKEGDLYISINGSGKIGFIDYLTDNNYVEIGNICINKKYQGRGIGSQILNEIINNNSNKTISLQVFIQNERAIKLYTKLGFKISSSSKTHHTMILEPRI